MDRCQSAAANWRQTANFEEKKTPSASQKMQIASKMHRQSRDKKPAVTGRRRPRNLPACCPNADEAANHTKSLGRSEQKNMKVRVKYPPLRDRFQRLVIAYHAERQTPRRKWAANSLIKPPISPPQNVPSQVTPPTALCVAQSIHTDLIKWCARCLISHPSSLPPR